MRRRQDVMARIALDRPLATTTKFFPPENVASKGRVLHRLVLGDLHELVSSIMK